MQPELILSPLWLPCSFPIMTVVFVFPNVSGLVFPLCMEVPNEFYQYDWDSIFFHCVCSPSVVVFPHYDTSPSQPRIYLSKNAKLTCRSSLALAPVALAPVLDRDLTHMESIVKVGPLLWQKSFWPLVSFFSKHSWQRSIIWSLRDYPDHQTVMTHELVQKWMELVYSLHPE